MKNIQVNKYTKKINDLFEIIFKAFILKKSRYSDYILNFFDEDKFDYIIPSEEIIKDYDLPKDALINFGYRNSSFFIVIFSEENKKDFSTVYWFNDTEKFLKKLIEISKKLKKFYELNYFFYKNLDKRFLGLDIKKLNLSIKKIEIDIDNFWNRHTPVKINFTKGFGAIFDPYVEHLAELEYKTIEILKRDFIFVDIKEKDIKKIQNYFKKIRMFLFFKFNNLNTIKEFIDNKKSYLLLSLLQPKNEKELHFLANIKIADSYSDIYGSFPYFFALDPSEKYIKITGSTKALKASDNKVHNFKFSTNLVVKEFEHDLLRSEDFDKMFELMMEAKRANQSYIDWYVETYGKYGPGYVPAND